MKRIAVFSPSAPPISMGGVASSHYHLARMLAKRGYIVKVFTFADFGIRPDSAENSEKIERFGSPKWLVLLIKIFCYGFFQLIDLLCFRSRTKAYQTADVLKAGYGATLSTMRLRQFKPDTLIFPDQAVPAFWIPRLPGVRNIVICHHNPLRFLENPRFGLHSKLDARIALGFERKALKKMDLVICPSRYMKRVFEETFSFSGRVQVVPNLIDTDLISEIQARVLGPVNGVPWVYIPSAGSEFKGSCYVPELVERLSRAMQGKIGFYLSGAMSSEQIEAINRVKGAALLFVPGLLGYRTHLESVKGCLLCVSPTLIENFSMALLEARLCGLFVVTFEVGGNSEVLEGPGPAGALVALGDLDAMIEKAKEFLKYSQGEVRSEGLSQFGVEAVMDQFIGAVT